MPSPEVAFACGSRSTTSARSPASARQAARLIAGRRLADAALLVRERVDLAGTLANLAAESDAKAARTKASALVARGRLGQRPLPRHARAAREAGRRRRPSCGAREARQGPRSSSPARRAATAATRARSAVGPTQSTTAPPSRTSGRHHSAAVGGCASALATATPAQSVSCSSARPQTTRAFGGADRSRNSHLRRSASSRTTSRSGQRVRERDPGRAATRADVHDRAVEARDELDPGERVVEQHPARLVRGRGAPSARASRARRQPRRQRSAVKRGGRRRSDSAPSPRSPSARPGTPCRRSCTTLRSTALIGSSSTRSPRGCALGARERRAPRASARRRSR